MSHLPNAHVGSVERLVPGKLVYVSTPRQMRSVPGYPTLVAPVIENDGNF
jgi:hypothetical protein